MAEAEMAARLVPVLRTASEALGADGERVGK